MSAVAASLAGDRVHAHETAPRIVSLEDVSRRYRVGAGEVRALDHVTMHIHAGEFVAVMGPSGCGKSTLLNVLGCLDRPTDGCYTLDGEVVDALASDRLADIRREKVGFVFQSYHLVPRMTAARNVELPLVLAGVDPRRRRDRVRAAFEAIGLVDRMHHRPDELSGGERQRVAIARAMILEPRLMLADEPTGNLDSRTGEEILGVLEGLHRRGLTLVLVTHDPRIGARAERLIRMRDGRIESEELPAGAAAAP
jgi:putative ABC transport system ATP-binding protein